MGLTIEYAHRLNDFFNALSLYAVLTLPQKKKCDFAEEGNWRPVWLSAYKKVQFSISFDSDVKDLACDA